MNPWPIPFELVVDHVYDGDTIAGDFTADAGLGVGVVFRGWRLRIYGINAPELSTADGKVCRDYLMTLVTPRVLLYVTSYSFDNYGKRIDGDASVNGQLLSQTMLAFGHGTVVM